MSPVKFCPEHGPYDASFEACPQCGKLPAEPRSLNEMDDLETDIGYERQTADISEEDTVIPGKGNSKSFPRDSTTILGSEIGHELDETQLDGSAPALVDAIFWVKNGNRRGRYYPIRNGIVIGRKEGGLILDDLTVSGTHAKITLEGNKYTIWDFGSANGTLVNGKRIREATVIDENDEIKIGDTVFIMKLLSAKKKAPKSTSTKAKLKTAGKTVPSKSSTSSKAKTGKLASEE